MWAPSPGLGRDRPVEWASVGLLRVMDGKEEVLSLQLHKHPWFFFLFFFYTPRS